MITDSQKQPAIFFPHPKFYLLTAFFTGCICIVSRFLIKSTPVFTAFIFFYISAAVIYIRNILKEKVAIDSSGITIHSKTVAWAAITNIEIEVYRIPKQEKDFKKLIISSIGMKNLELYEDRYSDFDSMREIILKNASLTRPEFKFLELI